MIINYFSILTILFLLVVPFLSFVRRLELAAVASMVGCYAFELGSIRVLPGPPVMLAVLLVSIYRLFLGRQNINVPRYHLLVASAAYASVLATTILAPLIWGSHLLVLPPSSQSLYQGLVPLRLSVSSFAQLIYIFFCIAILVISFAFSSIHCHLRILRPLLIFFFRISFLFSVIVVLEASSGILGFRIPFSDLLSSPFFMSVRIGYPLQEFGLNMSRAQVIFGEPSYYSVFLIGVYGACLLRFRDQALRGNILSLVLSIASLVLTFSSTAFVGMILITLVGLSVPTMLRPQPPLCLQSILKTVLFRRPSLPPALVVFAGLILLSIAAVLVHPVLFDFILGKLANNDGYETGNTSSAAIRFFSDSVAFNAFTSTYGIGVGAGGTRASSFIFNLLGNHGAIGFFFFILALSVLFQVLYSKRFFYLPSDFKLASLMVLGWLLGLALSVPDGFSFFYVWILLSAIVASLRSYRYFLSFDKA